MNNDPLLSVEYLSKSFPNGMERIDLLKAINLNLFAGNSMSIQGASGCGKTTFLNLIAGLENIDSGDVRWDGESIKLLSARDLHRKRAEFVGFIFQHYSLLSELSLLQNVMLPGRICGNLDRERGLDLIEQVGLTDRLSANIQTLSGGEKQRLAIARALYNNPRLVLADEPTGNLDEHSAAAIMQLLWDICKRSDAALVLITHNPAFAAAANFRYRLSDGGLLSI